MGSDLALKAQLADRGILDRFEARAIEWAERAGIRWIELEGELWTLVSELERKKGVEQGDFTTHAKPAPLLEIGATAPNGLQRLLKVRGVKRATVPTAFEVEGGYSLSCGGVGAKEGITAMVRRQVPDWALSHYTLVNLPLALSYLMHGRTEVAKATRDLTIGTTIDVGKAAAAQDNASMAAIQLSNDVNPAFRQLFAQLMALMATDTAKTQAMASEAVTTAVRADEKADQAIKDVNWLRDAVRRLPVRIRSRQPTDRTRQLLLDTWHKHYQGICPCCHVPVDEKNLQVEHWTSKDRAEHQHLWLTCAGCNTRLGLPEGDGGTRRTDQDRRRFTTFQELKGLPDVVQPRLALEG